MAADEGELTQEARRLASDQADRAEMTSVREHLAELTPGDRRTDCDEHGRILPGVMPGWGMSWWWHEQGLDPREARSLTVNGRFELMDRYWKAAGQGWEPFVPRDEWVGPYHPWEPSDD